MGTEIRDVYFRRAFIPIVLTILIFSTILVIVGTSPGKSVDWPLSVGGGLIRSLRGRL